MLQKIFQKLYKKSNQSGVGGAGEDAATRYLKLHGYKIIEQNWFNRTGKRLGEIDLIARERDGIIVFVEVKARSLDIYDESVVPQEQITRDKIKKLNRVAECYIKEKDLWNADWRLDAVSVIFIKDQKEPTINHIQSIFY